MGPAYKCSVNVMKKHFSTFTEISKGEFSCSGSRPKLVRPKGTEHCVLLFVSKHSFGVIPAYILVRPW